MQQRPLIWIGMFVGSTIGGFIPNLWGAGFLSFSGIILSGVGTCLSIYIGFKLSNW